MFGDGAFGPEGLVWCCSAFVVVPIFFISVFRFGRHIPGFGRIAIGFGIPALAFLGFGSLFGDAVGIAIAAVTFLFTSTVVATGFSNVSKRAKWQKRAEGFYFENFGLEKRKRSESDGEITIEM